ncbi:MAG: tetratricopeptide repeat protein [Acidobacteria bacterium]|nr:tetratricopeptide repeat protein [Acidobacteriota bacterium]
MNRTARVILLSILVCSLDLLATDTPTFTLKGAVVTPDGTMVPEFTVTVRAIVDKPELVPRKRFKDGVFTFTGLRRDQYQIHVYAPRFIGVKMDVNFRKTKPSQYRVIVLHKLRNELRTPFAHSYTVSAKVLQQNPPETARNAYARAVELHTEGKLEEALTAYGEAIRAYPEYLQALTDVGTVYILLNRPEAALTFLQRAQRIDGSNTTVRMNIAIALICKREYGEAKSALEQILKNEAKKSLPRYYLARVHFHEKNYDLAERELRLALEEDPGLIDGWVMLFNLALERDDYVTARERLERLRGTMNNRVFSNFVEDQLGELN